MFWRKRKQTDFNAEVEAHLEMELERLKEQGMSDSEARAAARRNFGNVTRAEERFYESGRWTGWESLGQDIRYSFRQIRRTPGFALVAVLTLALGIGANTALFSVVNGVLLNPLPYPDSGALVAIYGTTPGVAHGPITYLNFLDWQRDNQTFSSMAMYRNQDYNFTGTGEAERLSGYMVSAGFFPMLGVKPVLGRTFLKEDDQKGAAPVVILNEGFWQRKFGGTRDMVGKAVTLNGTSYTVVGIIPSWFRFYGQFRDVYTPIGQWNDPSFRDRRIDMSAHAAGRLRPGTTPQLAQADMDNVARRLAAAYPEADKDVGITLVPMKQDIVGNVQPFLLVLLGAVGFLLLIACANVANLFLARAMGRRREFAIRAALGCGRSRVIRQLLVESLLLSGMGGLFGLLMAFMGTRTMRALLPGTLPRVNEIAVDARVLLFTLAVSVLAGLFFGLAPALKTSRVNLLEVLKEGGRGPSGIRHRFQGTLIAVEVGLALVLLIGAGLMIRSLAALWKVDPGFNPSHAITFSLSLPASAGATSAETRARLRHFDAQMRSVPGVEAVSVTLGSRPMIHDSSLPFWIDGEPKPATIQDMHQAMFYLVEAGFRQAMDVRLERGRFITAQDNENAPVVVDIDDVFSRTYFPGQDPVGRHIHLALFNVDAEIVGVVGHVKQWGLDNDPKSAIEPQFDYPFMQMPEKLMPLVADAVAVVLRTHGDPTRVMGSVRQAITEMDPRQVVYNVQTMDEVVAGSYTARKFTMILLGIFAALALLLACVGIYGVISYLVGERTREIGVRMALGASRMAVLKLVVGHGLKVTLAGVAMGIAGGLALTRYMSRLLFSVQPSDPLTFVAVSLILIAVSLAACIIPARRASKVDPMVALRYE